MINPYPAPWPHSVPLPSLMLVSTAKQAKLSAHLRTLVLVLTAFPDTPNCLLIQVSAHMSPQKGHLQPPVVYHPPPPQHTFRCYVSFHFSL
jgi:hypothetical protein